MYQPQVNNPKIHSRTGGSYYSIEAELVIMETGEPIRIGDLCLHPNNGYTIVGDNKHLAFADTHGYRKVEALLISRTEEYTESDYVYNPHSKMKYAEGKWSKLVHASKCSFLFPYEYRRLGKYKVLALHKNLSEGFLIGITSGRLKDRSKVYLRCTEEVKSKHNGKYKEWTSVSNFLSTGLQGVERRFKVYLDEKEYVETVPVKESLEEAARSSAQKHYPETENGILNAVHVNAFRDGAEWAKQNEY